MEITILAGTTAKIPFRGIPGIDWIPADSSRNTRRTVKNSSKYTVLGESGHLHLLISQEQGDLFSLFKMWFAQERQYFNIA